MRIGTLALALVLGAAVLTGCDRSPGEPPNRLTRPSAAEGAPAADQTLSWGPTAGELEQARSLVADWSPERLAGQMIVGRYHGTDPAEPARLVRELHLAGVAVTSQNVLDAAQVRRTTRAVARAAAADERAFPPVIGVDQEGGLVSHLREVATEFPPFATAGAAIEAQPRRGREAVRRAAYATALELRGLGFTWVFAPVADVTIGAADPTIGSRAASGDPGVAAAATAAATRGYAAAGLVSTPKHFPGHGGVTADSHEVTPVLSSPLARLRSRDLLPFAAAVEAAAPVVMVSHVDVRAIAPGIPASLAEETYTLLREDLGFDGVAVTDSMGMGSVAGYERSGVRALRAGADLLLMPVDSRRTHATVTAAIRRGTLPRSRAEDAAAKVVALQLWQARVADELPVPADAARQAAAAARALTAAAY